MYIYLPLSIVAVTKLFSFITPSLSITVTVIEYSVASCRSVSVYIVSLAEISVMSLESVKH